MAESTPIRRETKGEQREQLLQHCLLWLKDAVPDQCCRFFTSMWILPNTQKYQLSYLVISINRKNFQKALALKALRQRLALRASR